MTLWIFVLVFVVFAVGVGAVQLLAALADRRRARAVENDESRIHPEDGGR